MGRGSKIAMQSNGVFKKILDNGLTVLIKEMHHAPVATWWVWYRVGSRNELPGRTGASHWVEHMMFKGTPKYPANVLDKLISREGGMWNAMTYIDWTTYYEVMPAEKIDLGIGLEADRMGGALFPSEEVEPERTVVISERQGSENSPTFQLYEEVTGIAFRVHPYHHTVIGDMIDLQTMTRDDLYTHYHAYYVPGNATAVLVGDVDTDAALAKIEALYGDIPSGESISAIKRQEPPQRAERRTTIRREGTTAYIVFAYRGLEITHPDIHALTVLDSILGGASSLNFFSTAQTSNKTSRLYRALVETELAASVSAGVTPSIDPYLYAFWVTVREGRTCQEVEEALNAEMDRAAGGDITEKEFEKARKQAKAIFAYDSESVSSQGFWLGMAETLAGDYEWFDSFLDRLMAVTLDDVRRVAAEVLQPTQRVVGWFDPIHSTAQEADS